MSNFGVLAEEYMYLVIDYSNQVITMNPVVWTFRSYQDYLS